MNPQEPGTRRNDILSAVGYATSELLRSVNWKTGLNGVLEKLGKAANANRAYYFENRFLSNGQIRMSQLAEWAAPGIEAEIDNPELQDLSYVQSGMQRWAKLMMNREPVHGLISDFPESERLILEPQDIRSIIAMPVFSRDKWVGFLGFDDCENQREWSKSEFDALLASAEALGAAIERQQLERELRFSQKMEVVGQLASGVAHDFNNVLQIIVGLADEAKLEMEAGENPKPLLDEIISIGTCSGSLTRQLLVFSNKQESSTEIIDLAEVMETVTAMVKTVGSGLVEFSITVADPAPTIVADAGLYTQVIINLCLNACDAMPDGGTLEIACNTVELGEGELAGHPDVRPGPYACCSVTDTGCGMDAALCKRVFEPFFTTKEVGKGTGLGLFVAHQSIRKCGGFIRVDSRPGVGTRFSVYVPLAEEALPSSFLGHPTLPGGCETILLVEDEVRSLRSMRQSLESVGYSVRTAGDGAQGLKMMHRYADAIDLVVTDFQLPQMNGLSMMKAIRESHPNTKFIVLSGTSNEGFPGDCPFLRKPISMSTLHQEIRRQLDPFDRLPAGL